MFGLLHDKCALCALMHNAPPGPHIPRLFQPKGPPDIIVAVVIYTETAGGQWVCPVAGEFNDLQT